MQKPTTRNSIKEILTPGLVGATEVTDDLTVDVQVVSLRTLEEPHPGCFRRAVSFPVIARPATGHQILPRRITSTGTWNDMIERQVLRRKYTAAVLAGVVVAEQDVLARKALSFKRNVNVFDQPDHRGHRH